MAPSQLQIMIPEQLKFIDSLYKSGRISADRANQMVGESGALKAGGFGPIHYSDDANAATSSSSSSSSSSGGSSGGGTTIDQAAVAAGQQSIDALNAQLGRLDNQKNIALSNADDVYNRDIAAQDAAIRKAKEAHDTNKLATGQDYRTAKNGIIDRNSTTLRSLQQMLGARGLGGSTVAAVKVPEVIQDSQNADFGGAANTWAKNLRNLDMSWKNTEDDDKQKRADMTDLRSNNRNSIEQNSMGTRQGLLSQLASASSALSAAKGGNAATIRAAGQGYLDQANAMGGQIDNLGRLVTRYNGGNTTYKAPTLDSYIASNRPTSSASMTGQNNANSTPTLEMLIGARQVQEEEKKKEQPLFY